MNMNKKELEAFAKEAAKGIKTPEDLNEFSQMLKMVIQCTSGTNGGITTGLMLKVLTEKITWQMVHCHHLL